MEASSWRARLVGAWDAVQVELHGCYSVARVRFFHGYATTTSGARTALVPALTPVPCLVAVAFADCIPLAPPEWGLAHSSGFWLRACFASWVYAYSTMEQLRHFMPELPISGRMTLALSIPVMALTNLCTFGLARAIGFPLPFTIPMLSVPWAAFMAGALWLRLRAYFRDNPDKRSQLVQFMCVLMCQLSLLVIYPAYNAVFYNLPAGSQLLFALLLPMIKLVEKNVISLFLHGLEDIKPEQIIFNVEVFNALFVACCMQNSNSIATNVVLVGVDFTMACISLRDLDAILVEVYALAKKMHIEPALLPEAVLALCYQYPQLESQATHTFLMDRLRQSRSRSRSVMKPPQHGGKISHASTPRGVVVHAFHEVESPVTARGHPRSFCLELSILLSRTKASSNTVRGAQAAEVTVTSLTTTDTSKQGLFSSVLAFQRGAFPLDESESSSRLRSTITSTISSLSMLKPVFPSRVFGDRARVSPTPADTRLVSNLRLLTENERLCLLEKTLQILHLTEFLLLIEYVEVMIPIVYTIYLVVLFHLPNRTFYPQLRDMDETGLYRAIRNVMMNAVFELMSLLLLVKVLRKKFHPSPLRQLAFVLDCQWQMVQSKLVLWVVVTLQSTLYHLGADYSFQFAWLHQNQKSPPPSPPTR